MLFIKGITNPTIHMARHETSQHPHKKCAGNKLALTLSTLLSSQESGATRASASRPPLGATRSTLLGCFRGVKSAFPFQSVGMAAVKQPLHLTCRDLRGQIRISGCLVPARPEGPSGVLWSFVLLSGSSEYITHLSGTRQIEQAVCAKGLVRGDVARPRR